MPTQTVYETITGGRIPLPELSDAEYDFLDIVAKKYNTRQDWTRFAAWWNAKFKASGLATDSVVYRICNDLEARLGINQRKVSPPDYRDYLAELIDTQFGSRQKFCRATGVDPGQLSRVLASRDNLSMKVLLQVLQVLHGRLVIQSEEESRAQTSVDLAAHALQALLSQRSQAAEVHPEPPPEIVTCSSASEQETGEQVVRAWEKCFPHVPNLDEVFARANAVAKQQMPMMIADAA